MEAATRGSSPVLALPSAEQSLLSQAHTATSQTKCSSLGIVLGTWLQGHRSSTNLQAVTALPEISIAVAGKGEVGCETLQLVKMSVGRISVWMGRSLCRMAP